MESHGENIKSNETTTPAVAPTSREEFDQIEGWSEELYCKTMYGYLAPMPLSDIPLPTEEDEEEEHKHESNKKKKRKMEGNVELFFKLFKFPEVGELYLLEMHEVRSGHVERYYLFAEESHGKWEARLWDLAPGTYIVFSVLKDPFILTNPPKHELSLQERLVGWSVEKRKRDFTGKEDTFYYHRGKQFRSLVEVTTFILYSTKLKDLKTTMFRISDQVITSAI